MQPINRAEACRVLPEQILLPALVKRLYKLASVSDFAGRYTQSTGKAGLSTSGGSDLWLENSAGVIMHLEGSSTGAMLTLGKDEIFVRMAQ